MAGCNNTLQSYKCRYCIQLSSDKDRAYYLTHYYYTTGLAGCNNTLHSLIKADIAYNWAVTKIELITSAIIIILQVWLAAITLYTVL